MLLSLSDLFLTALLLQLLLTCLSMSNGINLLILSELCWILLYANYIIYSFFLTAITCLAAAFIILALAAVDFSIWLLFLVCFYKNNTNEYMVYNLSNIKFLMRSGRLLRNNRYIN